MSTTRRLALISAPLVLALAACGSGGETADGLPVGEPIAHVAAPAGESWVETASETPESGIVIGNPNAPLKLVEYASHTCHVCANFSQEGAAKMDEYVATGVVSYELRNLIRDPIDLSISMLSRCSGPQAFHPLANQAWAEFDSMMAAIQANGAALEQAMQATEAERLQGVAQAAGLLDFFAARGISRDQAMSCLGDTAKATELVQKSQQQGDELAITGTPTFLLNGARIEGTNLASVEAALQAAGAR